MTAARFPFSAVKWTLLAGVVGIALAIWLVIHFGATRILDLLGDAGWLGITSIVAFHGIQILCSALGWRAIAEPAKPSVGLGSYFVLRWIREAVNNLLPFAQIGGEVVSSRLLSHRGTKLSFAIAGTAADLAMETTTQILFTLFGLTLLLLTGGDSGIASDLIVGVFVAIFFLTSLFAAVRFGWAKLIEDSLLRLGRFLRWQGIAHVQGVSEAIRACYREPSRVLRSGFWHLLGWLLGALEVCIALHFLGHDVDAKAGLVIESLGQAAKAIGFAVPGALGIQEGGYVAACAIFGLSADLAIALSILKRLREFILGIPALCAWHLWESKVRSSPSELIQDSVP